MYPLTHIILSLVLAVILKLLTALSSTEILIILLAAVLIDIDHYFYYVGNAIISEHPKNLQSFFGIFKKKGLSLFKAYNWFIELDKRMKKLSKIERKKYKLPLMVFHGIEFWILLLILSFYSKIFAFILIGIAVHMILDYIDLIIGKKPFYVKFSQVYNYLKNRNKREFY